ncbi:MATE family efflux transporter [Anaerosphaera multitolerans]|uniref:MATE family efflux transporter n=1 Tax=Anaerosphaera multitolerans TaxID=2487351 RepID=A0A437S6A7_9FIRM|nr:MATE family efflux transporter [Anaerosphaera multitolerans]RVU54517.1 MATE family efflux transporter [Anaerosphaera multitolerans]
MAMWVFSLYTMVDGYFVANYVGELEFSAINIAMPFVNGLFALAIIFGVGSSTVVGILLGENKKTEANKIFSSVLLVLIGFSLIITLIFNLFLPQVINFLGATESTYEFVKDYLQIILFFGIFFIISYNLEVMVKIDSFPLLATLGVFISGITNVILDYIFVARLNWGIKGAAVATGIAQVISTVLFLYHFILGNSNLKLVKTKLNLKIFKRIVPIGLGDFLNEMSTSFIILLFNNFLPSVLGEKSLISYTVISYVTLFVLITMSGLTQGMQPIVSYYYGKKEKKSYRKILMFSALAVGAFSLLFFIIVNSFTEGIVNIFLSKSEIDILNITYLGIHKYSYAYLLVGFNLLIGAFFAAIGQAKSSIIISIARGFLFILLSLNFAKSFLASENIWLAASISEGFALILSLLLLKYTFNNKKSLS